jgi:carbon monoxide dehydrogenase subunit G
LDILGEYRINASRQEVWEALNDPEVLRKCIPGCEQLNRDGDGPLNATINAKVGPVSARFKTVLTLQNINAPESYTLVGEGKGGAAGFGKGSADVTLAESGTLTLLSYNARFNVGGKLAQVGSRLVQGAARKTADQFFLNFAQELGGEPVAPLEAAEPGAPAAGVAPAAGGVALARRPWLWALVVLAVLLLGWWLLS